MTKNVDHGKTSVTKALTGTWTDVHSMEIKRGISIKLGYADTIFRLCEKCPSPKGYTTSEKCPVCGGASKVLRTVSFVDAPGHETLMATVIAGSSIIDGALLIIAANEKCPQAQTKEHKMILETLGIKNVVIVQNKIDLVTPEKAKENYDQIKKFLEGSIYTDAPIIPVAANYSLNIDVLIEAIEKNIPAPKRDEAKDPLMYIARSFDVNKPGTKIERLLGGVIGGSLIQGKFKVGDEIEIRPGIGGKETSTPIKTKIAGISAGKDKLKEALPGGLIGLSTFLDPNLTKADSLVGNVVGHPGKLPPINHEFTIEFSLFDRVDFENPLLRINEPIVVSVGTATTLGTVEKLKKNTAKVKLKRPICASGGSTVAISRRVGQRWRLSGKGKIL